MARGGRDPVRERVWRERVDRWRASGLSVREFCVRNGLTEPTFHFWKRELRTRDAVVSTSSAQKRRTKSAQKSPAKSPRKPPAKSARKPPAKSPQPRFVPVTVLPAWTVSVEVRCPSGHVVCLSSCEVSVLASLFAALNRPAGEEAPC